ncbi:LemA family protein [Reichenbachiella ulvae]|uniref:LemA family protein n=1 Tax=Reichenbachiella ulvae TaxID=2980104 RepID=A0ABT3CUS9_9BACT|nr:LemA family protein [Reichenbachiella ulvae]MCV9387392.1 LemA family protein [Reichenbachiella ulvae]
MEIIIITSALVLLAIIGIMINNRIIAKKNQVQQAYGSIEIYLKKRFDLIPNLIAMLKKYLAHEKEILLSITELRSKVDDASAANEKIKASNELTHLMSGLNISIESYPDLKADKQFSNIEFELSDIEDQISAARRAYNAAVTRYNDTIQMFPASMIASIRKDRTHELLEIPQSDQKEIHINQLLN